MSRTHSPQRFGADTKVGANALVRLREQEDEDDDDEEDDERDEEDEEDDEGEGYSV